MFTELLESRGRRERRSAVGVVSVCAHAALIVTAAVATSRAAAPPAPRPAVDTLLVYHPLPERTEPARAPDRAARGERRARASAEPLPPLPRVNEVVPGIPPTEVTLVGVERVVGSGARPDEAAAGSGGSAGTPPGGVYAAGDAYVEKPALAAPGSPQPHYPEMLRRAGVSGEVVAEFVVDTLGRVEPGTLRVVRSDHELFAAAVRAVLPALRFLPAEAGGRRVRQLVRQPFTFALR